MFDIQKNLKLLPDKPGVYLHKDNLGHVIYVGKAVSLKNRVRQYFQSQTNMPAKVRAMVANIEEFEYITTDSEMEALILECNLIKKYMPKYNVLLRDDKTYPYIKVTLGEDYPRIIKTRRVTDDGSEYFGPYSDAGSVNEIIDLLNNVYVLKRCSARSFADDFRPCLNYHIEQCRGICTGRVSRKEYMDCIRAVLDFLKGHNKNLLETLTQKMNEASESLNFEKAAEYRDKIAAVNAISEKQKVVLGNSNDMDMILTAKGAAGYHIVLFYVRGGKLSGRESFQLDSEGEDSREAVIASFIKQYYTKDMMIPREIAVELEPMDCRLLEDWLSDMRGARVKVFVPQKGEKRKLLDMAGRDVVEMMKVLDDRAAVRAERVNAVAKELNKVFGRRYRAMQAIREAAGSGAAVMESDAGYGEPEDHSENGTVENININSAERGGAVNVDAAGLADNVIVDTGGFECSWRIESYDISNTSGVDSVGAMVVFENGKSQRKSYRKFKIRTVEGPDDYSSMQEVIYRRFRRAQREDPGFAVRPDIIFVDGGLGHVHAVQEVLSAMNEHILVAGMVKDDRHRTRGLIVDEQEIDLKENPVLFRYVTSIQDEVHRFAIDYHRGVRNKTMVKSILDDAPGIGPRRKKELLARFGSVENMRNATEHELAETESMNSKAAADLYEYLKNNK
ncbi:MAG: excinuclease ABC subunit C [Firmicutes bacterium]|nr:excinuclease ABC subunit C [Bacillota bacterium]